MRGDVVFVALGGALGACARYLVGRWAVARFGSGFPVGTLIVNVTGSLLLGLVVGLVVGQAGAPARVRAFVGIGFCGAYTTFSTFAVDTVALAERPATAAAIVNVVANSGLALLAALVGLLLGRLWSSG